MTIRPNDDLESRAHARNRSVDKKTTEVPVAVSTKRYDPSQIYRDIFYFGGEICKIPGRTLASLPSFFETIWSSGPIGALFLLLARIAASIIFILSAVSIAVGLGGPRGKLLFSGVEVLAIALTGVFLYTSSRAYFQAKKASRKIYKDRGI